MNRITILLLSAMLVINNIGCTADKSGKPDQKAVTQPETASDSLAIQKIDDSIADFATIANAPLPELALADETKTVQVSTCQEFVSGIKEGPVNVEETTNNMQIFADYQPCITSWMLSRAQPSKKSFLTGDFANLLLDHLDLSSFPSSLGPRLENNKQILEAFHFKDTKTTDKQVTINDNGWTYEFTLLARGDFNSDGIEDLLIRFLDQAGEGNYFSLQTLILERNSSNAKITASNAISFIKNHN